MKTLILITTTSMLLAGAVDAAEQTKAAPAKQSKAVLTEAQMAKVIAGNSGLLPLSRYYGSPSPNNTYYYRTL